MTVTLAEIQARAYATAKSKGWHERPLRLHCVRGDTIAGTGRMEWLIDHDCVLRMHALMHTELTESHEAIEEGCDEMYFDGAKPEGLPVEIADFVIRVCDTTAALGLPLEQQGFLPGDVWWASAKSMRAAYEIQRSDDPQLLALAWLGVVRVLVDQATEAARVDDWARYADRLTVAVLTAASIVAGYGHDLPAAIEAKMSYNETRPHRHGGKRA